MFIRLLNISYTICYHIYNSKIQILLISCVFVGAEMKAYQDVLPSESSRLIKERYTVQDGHRAGCLHYISICKDQMVGAGV